MTTERINALADEIRQIAPRPNDGLGDELFLLVSCLTPIVNVDLLIKDQEGKTLLIWREDEYYAPGWHVPGGIVRFKERCADRVKAVAQGELCMDVSFDDHPISISEIIHPARSERGHFIALLYRCVPSGKPDQGLAYMGGKPVAGQWKWHMRCPDDLIAVQEMYRCYI